MRPKRAKTRHLSIGEASHISQKILQGTGVHTCRKIAANNGQKTIIVADSSGVSDTSDVKVVIPTIGTIQFIRYRLECKRDGGWDGICWIRFQRLQSICKGLGKGKAANGIILGETSDLLWNKKEGKHWSTIGRKQTKKRDERT